MNFLKKYKWGIIIVCLVFIVAIVSVMVAIITSNPKSDSDLNETTVDVISYPTESPSTSTDVGSETLDSKYEQVIIQEIETGIYVENLSTFKQSMVTSEFCEGLDEGIYMASLRIEGNKDVNVTNESESIQIKIANINVLGNEKFNELRNVYNSYTFEYNPSLFKTFCGGAGYSLLETEFGFNNVLTSGFNRNFLGGYQSIPALQHAAVTTSFFYQENSENIVEVSYYLSKDSILRFDNINNISTCIVDSELTGEYTGLDVLCTATQLDNDQENLQKIEDYIVPRLNDLIRVME